MQRIVILLAYQPGDSFPAAVVQRARCSVMAEYMGTALMASSCRQGERHWRTKGQVGLSVIKRASRISFLRNSEPLRLPWSSRHTRLGDQFDTSRGATDTYVLSQAARKGAWNGAGEAPVSTRCRQVMRRLSRIDPGTLIQSGQARRALPVADR